MKLKSKIILAATLLCAIPLILSSIFTISSASNKSQDALQELTEQRLISLRDVKKEVIEDYFGTIESQLLSLANSPVISTALNEFTQSFHLYAEETDQTNRRTTSRELKSYYDNDFAKRYIDRNPGIKSIDTQQLLNKLDDNSLALQNTYIARNSAPLGSKDSLAESNDGSQYSYYHAEYHPYLRDFLQRFGFYDIFLVDADSGVIVYSVFKELDFATSLKNGAYADSGIGKAFKSAVNASENKFVSISDFASYTPSYEDRASFIATPIFDHGIKKGVLIFQMPVDRINEIMTFNGHWRDAGLGESGETYLVGPDKRIRSESRFLTEDKDAYLSVLKQSGAIDSPTISLIEAKGTALGLQPVDSMGSTSALAGESGFAIFPDYRGVEVLSAYTSLDINGLNWALLAEIDKEEAFAAAEKLTSELMINSMAILLIMILLASSVAYYLGQSLAKPILGISTFITSVAAKLDLTGRFKLNRQDEIGDAADSLNNLLQTFQKSMGDVLDASGQIAAASEETSVITTQTSETIKKQLSETEQVATAMNEMTATVNEVAKNTTQTSASADEASENVNQGTQAMKETIASIRQLADRIDQTNVSIIELERNSSDISSVLDVISGVAEQTNLLALNAAIEAARAGEHGRGFAVVADEVRTLASRTQESTGEITRMIEQLQNGTKQAVSSMEQSKVQASSAVEQANATGIALTTISDSIHHINDMSTQIATAAEQQGAVAEEINRNVVHINDMTEQAAEGGVQTAQASTELAKLASSLNTLVNRFKI